MTVGERERERERENLGRGETQRGKIDIRERVHSSSIERETVRSTPLRSDMTRSI